MAGLLDCRGAAHSYKPAQGIVAGRRGIPDSTSGRAVSCRFVEEICAVDHPVSLARIAHSDGHRDHPYDRRTGHRGLGANSPWQILERTRDHQSEPPRYSDWTLRLGSAPDL